MLNVILQRIGAHSCTVPMFVELLLGESDIFFPQESVISDKSQIERRYGCRFHTDEIELIAAIKANSSHGILIFNTATEIGEDWAKAVLECWNGRVLVYQHQMRRDARDEVLEAFAHPFLGFEDYLFPIADVYAPPAEPLAVVGRARIVIPNWTRPSHLQNKNIDALIKAATNNPETAFILTGMSMEIMQNVVSMLPEKTNIEIKHQLNVEDLTNLLMNGHTYCWPLIHPQGRYAKQGLTASIPLAMNCDCPVILEKSIARIYDIRSFVDEAELSAVLNDKCNYPNLRTQVRRERLRIASVNRSRFLSLVQEEKPGVTLMSPNIEGHEAMEASQAAPKRSFGQSSMPIPPRHLLFMGGDQDPAKFMSNADELLARAVDGIEIGAGTILDVGCGYGRIAYALSNKGSERRYIG
jgi:hypothetical protein